MGALVKSIARFYPRGVGAKLVAIATALALVLVQGAIATTAAAAAAPRAAVQMPCDMDMAGSDRDQSSRKSPSAADHSCPLMSGATCIALTAAIAPEARDFAIAAVSISYLWPADAAVVARTAAPPDRPPKPL